MLEKRDVYIKEFWIMSFFDRYVYSVVNKYNRLIMPEFNPLNWSVKSLSLLIVTAAVCLILPFFCVYDAFYLKNAPMPNCRDPQFKDGQDWRVTNKWVVKRKKDNKC